MLVERLDEKIKVRADFKGGTIKPLVFVGAARSTE